MPGYLMKNHVVANWPGKTQNSHISDLIRSPRSLRSGVGGRCIRSTEPNKRHDLDWLCTCGVGVADL